MQPATAGTGPLLQHDYSVVINGCELDPAELIADVRELFCDLLPRGLAEGRRCRGEGSQLGFGDDLDISMRGACEGRVRVVHVDASSFTLATLHGHVQAGRITFAASRSAPGELVFAIRSRMRASGSGASDAGAADALRTSVWTGFLAEVALTWGEGIRGAVRVASETLHPGALDEGDARMDRPTLPAGSGAGSIAA